VISLIEPLANRVLFQIKRVPKRSAGGIELPEESRQAESDNMSVAKVIKLGPLAYRKRDTMEPWVEGVWVNEGDYVRIPRWGGDRWVQAVDTKKYTHKEPVLFAILNDHEVIGKIVGDPLALRAYI
jgi:co-chaperonin GroES (HSP10)